MKVSVREDTIGEGLARLLVYRPRGQKSLAGSAYETKSGYWIVNIPNKVSDVVGCKADAAAALQEYYAPRA